MPSLALSDRKEVKEEKMKKKIALENMEETGTPIEKKKKKKESKLKAGDSEDELNSEKKKSKKKEGKKRKVSEIEDGEEEQKSDTSSELGEPVNLKSEKKKKKAKVAEAVDEETEHPNALSRFQISEPLRNKLKSKGIQSLFPIQAMTFDMILNGCDLVGRARTGQVY